MRTYVLETFIHMYSTACCNSNNTIFLFSKFSKNIFLGQMIYMENWKAMMYLGTPVMPDLNSLIYSGLYINDLSMHDFSR